MPSRRSRGPRNSRHPPPAISVFDATDAGKTFTGTLEFTGPEWNWTGWTYALELTAGGSIQGKGRIDATGIHTDKTIFNQDKIAVLSLIEDLAPITQKEYDRRRDEMMNPPER